MTHGSISLWTDQSDCSRMTFLRPTQRLHGKRNHIQDWASLAASGCSVKHCTLVILCYRICYVICEWWLINRYLNFAVCVCRYMVPIVWMPLVIYLSWYCYALLAQERTRLFITSGVCKVCFKTFLFDLPKIHWSIILVLFINYYFNLYYMYIFQFFFPKLN